MSNTKIFFNEKLHRYTDEFGNEFTSVTTVIGKYKEKFNREEMARRCARIGMNPSHPKYEKYKNKSTKQLLNEWEDITNKALDKGNRKHNYLEDVIKHSNNYNRVEGIFINDRIFTVPDIIEDSKVGEVSLNTLIKLGLKSKYPIIFSAIEEFVKDSWRIYSEIGVYNSKLLISGLIDLLLIKDDLFFIIDWKTNKAPIMYEAGYFEKDNNGNLTNKFKRTDKTLLYPLAHIPASNGHEYTMQLSSYTYLVEAFGLKPAGILLSHIREIEDLNGNKHSEEVKLLPIKYLKEDVKTMFEHHYSFLAIKTQNKIFV